MASDFSSLVLGSIVVLAAAAAIVDGRTGRLPNWLTLPFLALGLIANGLAQGLSGLAASSCGMLVCALVPWLMFLASGGGAIGGGDVKLAAAVGALAGPSLGLEIELASLIALAFIALVRLTYDGKLLRVLSNVLILAANPFRGRERRIAIAPASLTEMRLGPGVAAGVFLVITSELLTRWLPWLA